MDQQDEIMEKRAERRVQRLAAADRARAEAEVEAARAELAREFALTPEGIAAARAEEEAADAAEADRAAAMVARDAAILAATHSAAREAAEAAATAAVLAEKAALLPEFREVGGGASSAMGAADEEDAEDGGEGGAEVGEEEMAVRKEYADILDRLAMESNPDDDREDEVEGEEEGEEDREEHGAGGEDESETQGTEMDTDSPLTQSSPETVPTTPVAPRRRVSRPKPRLVVHPSPST